jgi:hypothetical protein
MSHALPNSYDQQLLQPSKKLLLSAFFTGLSLLATGCAMNPYVHTEGLQASLPGAVVPTVPVKTITKITSLSTVVATTSELTPTAAITTGTATVGAPATVQTTRTHTTTTSTTSVISTTETSIITPRFAGDLEKAIADVDGQRTAYLSKLASRTVQRNLLSGSLIGLSAAALYKGATATAGANNRSVFNFGALAGGAYALGNYSNSPKTEFAYINAANNLSCLVMRTRPWLVTGSDYDAFNVSVATLVTATDALDTLYQVQAAKSGNSRKFVADHPFERIILNKARTTLRKASHFKGYVETAGFQLRQEAMLVTNAANLAIHEAQPDLVNPANVLTGLRNTSQAFRDIKPLDVSPASTQQDATEPPATGPQAGKETTKPDTPATPESSVPAASPTAASGLGKAADDLTKQINAQAVLLAAQKKANDQTAKKTQEDISNLKTSLDAIYKALAAWKLGETARLNITVNNLTTADAESLARTLSAVLSAMRPVNAVLTRAYSLKPYVKSIPECQPLNAQAFEFAQDDDVTLGQGQSISFAVKGGTGIPRFWLSGAKGNEKGQMPELTTSIDGGVAQVKLKLLADTPPGEMQVMAADGSGKQRDDIKVIVVAPPANK